MGERHFILFFVIITLFSCKATNIDQSIKQNKEFGPDQNVPNSAMEFAEIVLGEKLRVHSYERSISGYLDVQMLFETEELLGYTGFSNEIYQKYPDSGNYDGCILFVANYKNVESAKYAFTHLKFNSGIRISELEGFAGLVVEQVQVLERIRMSGGMFAQKDNYVFYLLETCGDPLVESNWTDYENLFLGSITEKNEKIQVINADCGEERLVVEKIKARR